MGISPESTKGSAPNKDMQIHASATTARPSRAYSAVLLGFFPLITPPHSTSSAAGIKNGHGASPYKRATSRGSSSSAASVSRILPMT